MKVFGIGRVEYECWLGLCSLLVWFVVFLFISSLGKGGPGPVTSILHGLFLMLFL